MGVPYFPLDRLSLLLGWARGFSYQARFDRNGPRLSDQSPFSRIQYCAQALLAGALPDAETLEFVAIAFQRYVDAEGTLSLDEAFKLKSKPKAGNPARQYAHHNKVTGLLIRMAMIRGYRPKTSLEESAEAALNGDESINVETLVRDYRRRRCNKWAAEWAKEFAAINRINRL